MDVASLRRQVDSASADDRLPPAERAAKLRSLRNQLEYALAETDRRVAEASRVAEGEASLRVADHLFVRSNAGLRESLEGFDGDELDASGMLTFEEVEALREEGLLESVVGGLRKEWEETLHPRGRGGKFSSKFGAPTAPPTVKLPRVQAPAPRPAAPARPAARAPHVAPGALAGRKPDKLVTSDINEAVKALGEGRKVELNQPREVSTLIRALNKVAQDAKAAGQDAPNFDLCNVTVKGTNIFCVESKGIDRLQMPQLKGVPLPGTRADKMERDKRGEVDLAGLFRDHLIRKGVKLTKSTERASYLRASQRELDGVKVAGIMDYIENGGMIEGPPLFISREGYVVDGHHRWAAQIGKDFDDGNTDPSMDVERIDMPILDLLAESNAFAKKWGLPQAAVHAKENPGAKHAKPATTAIGITPFVAGEDSPVDFFSGAKEKEFVTDLTEYASLYDVTVKKHERVEGLSDGEKEPAMWVTAEGNEESIRRWAEELGKKYAQHGVLMFAEDPNGDAAQFRFPGAQEQADRFFEELKHQGLGGATVHKDGIGIVVTDEADAAKVHAVAETLGLDYSYATGNVNADLLGGHFADA